MGTHATIGLADTDGAIDFTYLHQDGYPSGAGDILHRHYDDAETRRLIDLGWVDASLEIHDKIGERKGYAAIIETEEQKQRARNTDPACYRAGDTNDFLAQSLALCAHYIYLRQDGIWLAAHRSKTGVSVLSPLADTYLDPQAPSDSRIIALDAALAGYIEAQIISGGARNSNPQTATALFAFYDLLDATLAAATPDDAKMIEARYPY